MAILYVQAFLTNSAGVDIILMIEQAIANSGRSDVMLPAMGHLRNIIGPYRAATFQAQHLGRVVCRIIIVDVLYLLHGKYPLDWLLFLSSVYTPC